MSENALYRPLLFVFIVVFSSTYAKEEKIVINPTGNLLAGYHQLGACTQSDQPLYTYIHACIQTYIHTYVYMHVKPYFPSQTNLWSFSSRLSVFTVPCYQRSLTTRQKWEKGERLPFVSFLPRRERPMIAGNLCGRLFKDSGSNYLRNIFTALAVGLSRR